MQKQIIFSRGKINVLELNPAVGESIAQGIWATATTKKQIREKIS